jgi:hypothetical protein
MSNPATSIQAPAIRLDRVILPSVLQERLLMFGNSGNSLRLGGKYLLDCFERSNQTILKVQQAQAQLKGAESSIPAQEAIKMQELLKFCKDKVCHYCKEMLVAECVRLIQSRGSASIASDLMYLLDNISGDFLR